MSAESLRIGVRPQCTIGAPRLGSDPSAHGSHTRSGYTPRVPFTNRPPAARDCPDCGEKNGMKLQNVAGTAPRNIPLMYVCERCRCTMTIPPPRNPLGDA